MAVPKVRGLSRDLDQIQERTDRGIAESVPSWIRDGRSIQGVAIASSAVTRVLHKLGRRPNGWTLQRVVSTGGDVRLVETTSDDNAINILNGGSNACTIDLWVW